MHCRKANKTKQNLSHLLLLLKHIWSLSNNHSFLWEKMFNVSSNRNQTRFIMAAADKRHVLEEDEDEEQRKSKQNDVIATQESKKQKASIQTKIKCWKYLSESFSWDVAGDSGWGKKYGCTVRRPKKKTAGRKKGEERPFPHRSQDKGKGRERGVRAYSPSHTNPCQHWADSAMPSYSPAHFSPAAKRERSQQHEKGKESKTATTLRLGLWLRLLLLG